MHKAQAASKQKSAVSKQKSAVSKQQSAKLDACERSKVQQQVQPSRLVSLDRWFLF